MSARRRQETIAQFSVPIEEDDTPIAIEVEDAPSRPTRSTRTRSSQATATVLSDGDAADDDLDDDFVVGGEVDEDDDFIDDEEEQPAKRKGKGKGKAKGKRKATPASKTSSGYCTPASGTNPKVMLISLKAGALGLNLTVANNVYL